MVDLGPILVPGEEGLEYPVAKTLKITFSPSTQKETRVGAEWMNVYEREKGGALASVTLTCWLFRNACLHSVPFIKGVDPICVGRSTA